MNSIPVTQAQRDALVGQRCTLDGQEATIVGRLARFAVVRQVPCGCQAEYAWETVLRIMARDGAFRR